MEPGWHGCKKSGTQVAPVHASFVTEAAMTAPQASTIPTEGFAANGAAPVVIAQATVTPIANPGAVSSVAPAAAAGPASIGTLSNATPGVAVMRDGVSIPVDGNQTLVAGDRVIVPADGHANVLFPGSATNKADGAALDSVVTWTLTSVAGGTHVRMVHDGFRSPRNDFAFTEMGKGWGIVLPRISQIAAEL